MSENYNDDEIQMMEKRRKIKQRNSVSFAADRRVRLAR